VLVRQLRALGGTLHLRAEAAHIELDGGSVAAVHTADQRRFPADLVIANAHPATTLALLPDGAVRPAYRTRVTDATPGRAHLGLYLQVEGDLSDLARRNLYRFDAWDPDASAAPARPGHLPFWFLTAPGGRDGGRTADGVVLGLAQVPWDDVAGLDRSSASYHAYKEAMRDTFLDAIRRDYPGWVVRRAEVSTPLTTERFTRSPHGATYGHYHSVAQMGRYRLPMFNRVRGLVHVGQSVGFPGICGAMMSTYVALSDVLGVETLLAGLRAG
jgi:phytoene dehydrogenase-like protein